MNRISFLVLSVALICEIAAARDIDLDGIYINKKSPQYLKLVDLKLEMYRIAGSFFIDSDCIFSFWAGGDELLYIRETPSVNILYQFSRKKMKSAELFRTGGIITAARISPNGRFLYLKKLRINDAGISSGETVILNTKTMEEKTILAKYQFLDFTLSPSGNSIIIEEENGMVEFFPDTNYKKLILARGRYSDIAAPGQAALCYISPNGSRQVVACGGAGSYSAKIITGGGSWLLNGVTSSSELFWIDNERLVYRKGQPGGFSVCLYGTEDRSGISLLDNSMNTNIYYSPYPKIISFLDNQVIWLYSLRDDSFLKTGLEGEDVLCTPDGSRFISLYLKKLFITDLNVLKGRKADLRNTMRMIQDQYTALLPHKSGWTNEFTGEYLRKKIAAYRELLKQ